MFENSNPFRNYAPLLLGGDDDDNNDNDNDDDNNDNDDDDDEDDDDDVGDFHPRFSYRILSLVYLPRGHFSASWWKKAPKSKRSPFAWI